MDRAELYVKLFGLSSPVGCVPSGSDLSVRLEGGKRARVKSENRAILFASEEDFAKRVRVVTSPTPKTGEEEKAEEGDNR